MHLIKGLVNDRRIDIDRLRGSLATKGAIKVTAARELKGQTVQKSFSVMEIIYRYQSFLKAKAA